MKYYKHKEKNSLYRIICYYYNVGNKPIIVKRQIRKGNRN